MRQELTRHAFARIKGGGIVVKYTAHQASKYEVPQGTTKESPHESVSTIKPGGQPSPVMGDRGGNTKSHQGPQKKAHTRV